MQKEDRGYVYKNNRERKQSRSWLRKNSRKIPKMDVGSRINGDPIVYMGQQPPDYFTLMQSMPAHFEG